MELEGRINDYIYASRIAVVVVKILYSTIIREKIGTILDYF